MLRSLLDIKRRRRRREPGRILLLADDVPPNTGGVAGYLRALYEELPGRAVTLVTPARPGSPGLLGCHVVTYERPAWMPLHVIRLTAVALRAALRQRPEAIHCGSLLPAACAALSLRVVTGLPYLVHVYGTDVTTPRPWPYRVVLRQVLRRAGRVVAVSEFTRAAAVRAGARPDRTVVIHPPVDVAWLSDGLRAPAPSARIVTVARLVSRKGHDAVLRAVALARDDVPELRYDIVGDGPERAELEALASQLGLGEAVRFHGRVADVRPHLHGCAAFVMANRTEPARAEVEGFGTALCEASACGRPVIAGRSGGVPEAVIDGETGLLVDPDDPRAIAHAIVRLLADRDYAERLGRQGRARVERALRPDAARARLLAVAEAM